MYMPVYLENRDVAQAQDLMAQYGKAARSEAASRANASRDIGNHISFCRWRQIERLISMLSQQATLGTIH